MQVFDHGVFGTMQVENRLGVPAMCTYKVESKDGVANDFHMAHYATLAMGKPGFIIQEATAVNEHGHISNRCLGIYTPRQQEALKRIVDNVHAYHVPIGIQLNHAGIKNEFGNQKVGPMDMPDKQIHGLSKAQIDGVIRDFTFACKWAKDIGYDFVEIHGAHGYLIHQFLSPLTNQRSDEYGQDRTLLLKRIVEAALSMFHGCVVVRLSVEDYEEHGLHPEDYVEIVQKLQDMGVHAISISSGGLNKTPPTVFPKYQIPYASYIKKHVTIPVMGVGLMYKKSDIVPVLEKEECDFVLLGRKMLRDPFFILKWKEELGILHKQDIDEYLYRGIHY